MRRRKNLYASLDPGPQGIKLAIVKKGITGLKTLITETFDRKDLATLNHRIEEYRPREVILLLPQERVLVRDMVLPPVDKNRIKPMLYFELSGLLPYAMEQVQVDYIIMNASRKELQLKAFIIPDPLLQEAQILQQAGVPVNRLVPRGLAITAFVQQNKEIKDRLIQVKNDQGQLVLYPDYQNYFSRFYHQDQIIDLEELKQIASEQGIEPIRWDLFEVNNPDAELLGAIYFHFKQRRFNLLPFVEKDRSANLLKFGIIFTLIAILLANAGTFYLKYTMAKSELSAYKERLDILIPRTEKVKTVRGDLTQFTESYERLQKIYEENTDYLIWFRELHLLLQEDTEVNLLVFEGDELQELHGVAPSASKVTERLNRSLYFQNVEFTSPITPRLYGDKELEEFSITAKLVDPHRKGAGEDE